MIPDKGSWLQLIKDGTTQFNTGANGIQRLDKVVELAKKYNIYVYFTLTNNWFPSSSDSPPPPAAPSPLPRNFLSNDYCKYSVLVELCTLFLTGYYIGGMDAYVREFGVEKKHDEFYTDMNIRQEFYKYLQFVVSRYVDEPNIIAWELANDARCNSTVCATGQCNTNTVTLWHAQTAEFVRSIDPNHLITSGYAHILSLLHSTLISILIHQEPWLLLSGLPEVIPTSTPTCAFPSSWRD